MTLKMFFLISLGLYTFVWSQLSMRVTDKPEKEFQAKTAYTQLSSYQEVNTTFQQELIQKIEQNRMNILARQEITFVFLVGLFCFFSMLPMYILFEQYKQKKRTLLADAHLKNIMVEIENQNHIQQQHIQMLAELYKNINARLNYIATSIDKLHFSTQDTHTVASKKISEINSFTQDAITQFRDTIWAMRNLI